MGTARQSARARAAWLLALAFVCGASFPFLSRMMNANERPRLLQAVAIVDHGTLALDPVEIDPGIDVARGVGGATYPNKPPGATVPAVLAYSVQRAWCGLLDCTPTLRGLTLLARIFGAVLPVVLLVHFALRRLGDDAIARLAVLVLVVATPLWSYGHLLFSHALAALAMFVGVTKLGDAARDEDLRAAAIGGACAGATVVLEYVAVFAALPIAVWLLRRRRTLVAATIGALVPIALLALYHQHAFGSPWATSYHSTVDPLSAEQVAHGLLGLDVPKPAAVVEDLISPWGGLFYFAPLVVIAPLAWKLAPHDDRTHVRLHLAVLATLVLATLCIDQAGGWRVGPRHVVLAMPALAPALALVLRQRSDREGLLAIVLGLALWGLLVNGLAASWFPTLIPEGNPLRDQLLPLVVRGHQPYTVVDGWRGVVPLAGMLPIALAIGLGARAAREVIPPALRRRVAVGTLVVTAAIVIAAWSVPPSEEASPNLAAIESIWEPGNARASVVKPLR
ncbi:MAG TPA: hypothetical protein VG755_04110 [Nannocystaceae bacterium]|nr:hypothetical protein [Nannocystaceae bacterium]